MGNSSLTNGEEEGWRKWKEEEEGKEIDPVGRRRRREERKLTW